MGAQQSFENGLKQFELGGLHCTRNPHAVSMQDILVLRTYVHMATRAVVVVTWPMHTCGFLVCFIEQLFPHCFPVTKHSVAGEGTFEGAFPTPIAPPFLQFLYRDGRQKALWKGHVLWRISWEESHYQLLWQIVKSRILGRLFRLWWQRGL